MGCPEEVSFETVYDRALRLLELRDHSRSELQNKLLTKFGYHNKETIMLVLEKLSENGFLDDGHFARVYAEELVRKKHVSEKALRYALSVKGIDRQMINEVVEECCMDPAESINILLDTKFSRADLLDERQCDKTITALYRLGFMLSDIKDVIAERQREKRIGLLEKT